ncbi:hypothetical protein ACA097_07705 [Pseudomonas sp. QL9]|uniref:hypothetical protein n=1 Tax=Pseudomonas sp. QL9 TaxID=3242725 RepID=UPI003529F545
MEVKFFDAVIMGLALCVCMLNADADELVPTFQDYRVDSVFSGPNHDLAVSAQSGALWGEYRKEAIKRKVNFAGHYIIYTGGCGGGAICGEILDAMTGEVISGFPNFHPIGLISAIAKGIGALDKLIRRVGDIISHGEGGYESYNTGTKNVPGDRVGFSFISPPVGTVTAKTINEILATETLSGLDRDRLFATGKYQTIIATLRVAKSVLNLSGDEFYDEELQERVFREYLIDKAGDGSLGGFIKNGRGSVDSAQLAAAKEWASIAAPAGSQIKDGRISDGRLSYHESQANSANQRSTLMLREILFEISGG